jgi:hypothetical protein
MLQPSSDRLQTLPQGSQTRCEPCRMVAEPYQKHLRYVADLTRGYQTCCRPLPTISEPCHKGIGHVANLSRQSPNLSRRVSDLLRTSSNSLRTFPEGYQTRCRPCQTVSERFHKGLRHVATLFQPSPKVPIRVSDTLQTLSDGLRTFS